MYGAGSRVNQGLPNLFPDLTNIGKTVVSPSRSQTVASVIKPQNKAKVSSSSSDDESFSTTFSRSSPSPSPARIPEKKRKHSSHLNKEVKKQKKDGPLQPHTSDEVSAQMDALKKNELDISRLKRDRETLQESYDTHRDKLKELAAIEESVEKQKDMLARSTRMVEENMKYLEELEEKESALLRRVEELEREKALFDKKEREWNLLRDKIALALDFNKK